jgi:mannose-6-phosphate isomerase-like protein (cupin superfamily)
MRGPGWMIGVGVMSAALTLCAQAQHPVDHWTNAELQAQAKTLLAKAKASPDGLASAELATYAGHKTLIYARVKSGGGEMHRDWNDVFFVVEGEASEYTGGKVVDGKEISPGEVRGVKTEGGTPNPLTRGDVLHIAPNVAHQMMVAPGKSVVYYAVKVAAK